MTITLSSYPARIQCPSDIWSLVASNLTIKEAKEQFFSFQDYAEKLDLRSEAQIFTEHLLQGIDTQAAVYAAQAEDHLKKVHGLDWKRQFGFSVGSEFLSNIERVDLVAKIVFEETTQLKLDGFFDQYRVNRCRRFNQFKKILERKIPQNLNFQIDFDSLMKDPPLIVRDPNRKIDAAIKKQLLESAVKGNYWEIIEDFLSADFIQSADLNDVLIRYAWGARMIAVLLKSGACPNALADISIHPYTPLDGTVLHSLVSSPSDCALKLVPDCQLWICCKVLLAAGADINARNSIGITPLHLSIRWFDSKLMEIFIDLSADLNTEEGNGISPLCSLMYSGRRSRIDPDYNLSMKPAQKMFYQLVNAHVDRNIPIKCKTLLQYARILEHREIADMVWAMQALCKAGFNVNARDDKNKTPLHYFSNLESTQFLIEQGADVNARDNEGKTPLICVIETISEISLCCPSCWLDGRPGEVVAFLLSNGANPNIGDNEGRTPLNYARRGLKKCSQEVKSKIISDLRRATTQKLDWVDHCRHILFKLYPNNLKN